MALYRAEYRTNAVLHPASPRGKRGVRGRKHGGSSPRAYRAVTEEEAASWLPYSQPNKALAVLHSRSFMTWRAASASGMSLPTSTHVASPSMHTVSHASSAGRDVLGAISRWLAWCMI